MNARSPYLTTTEAAAYLRYRSASAIRNLVVAGRLRPAGRRGRTWLFLVSELDASVASHGASVAPAGDDHAETDPIPRNRSPSRWPQAHPAASHGPQNRPDEGGGPSHRGDGGKRVGDSTDRRQPPTPSQPDRLRQPPECSREFRVRSGRVELPQSYDHQNLNLNRCRITDENLRRGGANCHTGSRSATHRHGQVGKKWGREDTGNGVWRGTNFGAAVVPADGPIKTVSVNRRSLRMPSRVPVFTVFPVISSRITPRGRPRSGPVVASSTWRPCSLRQVDSSRSAPPGDRRRLSARRRRTRAARHADQARRTEVRRRRSVGRHPAG